uniref:Phosphodiesterase n=1 Tax=Trichuris muris TaxID=70415 RepID=A0A5S6R2D3_TRIMR
MLQGSYLLNKKFKALKLSGDGRPPSGDVSKFSLRRRLSKKKNVDFDVDKKPGKDQGKQGAAGASHYRRGSFLYRIDSDAELPHGATRHSDQQHGEDLIVTPFAQVLATLRSVRENIVALTQSADRASTSAAQRPSQLGPSPAAAEASPAAPSGTVVESMPDEATQHLAESTLMELDWCLEQLEAIQTHRSVSEMTSSKFRKMLTKELSQFSDSKSGDQLSRFIFSTFMGHDDDLELASEKQKQTTGSLKESDEEKPFGASSKMGRTKQHVTSAMSFISGVHKLKKSPTNAEETVAAALSDSTLMACTYSGGKFTPELENAIGDIDRWGMDIFKFHRLCDSHSLTTVTFTVMKNRGLIKEFRINTTALLTYLLHLEDHYRQNSYHNSIHATDVTQTVHVMFSAPSLNSVFTDLEKFAVIFAAAIHDVDHPGLTNQFLVNSGSELAIMYNDESVLEQHHLAVAFKLLQESDCDILTGLSQKQRQLFRRIVIDTVLATDMSKHMSLLADLKTMVETKKLSGPGLPKLEKYGDRIQVLQNLIHIADLSNPSKPLPLYEQWVDRLLEEYWRQGDKEKELGLEVSPMCDRQNVSREKSQVGFIDYIVHPLMETWADLVYPDGQQILDQLEQNRNNFFVRLTEKDQEEFPVAT